MQYYPLYLDLRGRPCVVIGGGAEAEGKITGLLAAGARVTVVSATLTPTLGELAATHEIIHHGRDYRRGDLAGAALAYAAVQEEDRQIEIAAEAEEAGVLLNVVDTPRFCTFIAPAVVTRGPVSIAVSTGGTSPALAKRLRQELEKSVGPEYGIVATILGKLRPSVAATEPDPTARARVFGALLDAPLVAAVRAGDPVAVDAILERVVGNGTTLARLGVRLGPPTAPQRTDGAPAS